MKRRHVVALHVAALVVLLVSIAEGDLPAALFAVGFVVLWWVIQGAGVLRARREGGDEGGPEA
jgi:hypothetical protein